MLPDARSPGLATPATDAIATERQNLPNTGNEAAPQGTGSVLARYEAARTALAECRSVDDVRLLRNKSIALQVYARQAKDRELIDHATEIRLRAERRAGELLAQMKERGEREARGGDRKSKCSASTLIAPPQLADLGITKSQSSNWQRLAAIEAQVFEARVERAKRKAVNVLDGVARRTRQEMHTDDEMRVARLRPAVGTFRTLVIDPPWRSDWLSDASQKTPGYATMTVDQIRALPIPQWAAGDCHLYCWVTNNFMAEGCKLVAGWGFQHRTVITWRKPRYGLGSYFRNQTEHVIFATRGDLRTRSDSIPTIFDAPIGEHSEKPERFYDIVRAASYLPAGEAFQRKLRDGFVNLYDDAEPPAADSLDSIPPFLRRAAASPASS